jgi:hypothetical protein
LGELLGTKSLSLAVHTSSHAERYGVFIPRYWEAMKSLNRQPDQIVILYHESNLARFPESVPSQYKSRVKVVETNKQHSAETVNLNIEAAETDWVAFCGLDDQLFPEAYDELTDVGEAEILVGNVKMSNGVDFRGVWDPELLKSRNTLTALSPYRKALWERVGGWPNIRWNDWGFWIKCAMAGVQTFQGTNFQALFDVGETHLTDSGRMLSEDLRQAGERELRQFAIEMGFI